MGRQEARDASEPRTPDVDCNPPTCSDGVAHGACARGASGAPRWFCVAPWRNGAQRSASQQAEAACAWPGRSGMPLWLHPLAVRVCLRPCTRRSAPCSTRAFAALLPCGGWRGARTPPGGGWTQTTVQALLSQLALLGPCRRAHCASTTGPTARPPVAPVPVASVRAALPRAGHGRRGRGLRPRSGCTGCLSSACRLRRRQRLDGLLRRGADRDGTHPQGWRAPRQATARRAGRGSPAPGRPRRSARSLTRCAARRPASAAPCWTCSRARCRTAPARRRARPAGARAAGGWPACACMRRPRGDRASRRSRAWVAGLSAGAFARARPPAHKRELTTLSLPASVDAQRLQARHAKDI